jgi:hypothetical protein
MSTKRIIALGAMFAAAIVAVLAAGSGLLNFAAFVVYVGIVQPLFPSTIGWDAKNAYLKCEGAIADPAKWPPGARVACAAMNLCANEARLSEKQYDALLETMKKTPGCQAP